MAITGRDGDHDKVDGWVREKKTGPLWRHVSWRQVYHVASALAGDDSWARELHEYMNIVSSQLDEGKMDPNVKIVAFTGIPFKAFEDYDIRIVKRVLRSLICSLDEDKAFLKALGFRKGQLPRHRKKIGNEMHV